MIREVRGLGVIIDRTAVELTIPTSHVDDVHRGHMVDVDLPTAGILKGRVIRVEPMGVNTTSSVTVRLSQATTVAYGTSIDGRIELERLSDVVYVGRPVVGNPNSVGTIFKIDPDGAHAADRRYVHQLSHNSESVPLICETSILGLFRRVSDNLRLEMVCN